MVWHQGESDAAAATTTDDYASRLETVIAQSRRDAGFDMRWGIALVSYVPGVDPAAEAAVVAGQQRVIHSDPLVFEGPTTDDLVGADYRYDGIHFNERGLREHARRWAEAIAALNLEPGVRRVWLPWAVGGVVGEGNAPTHPPPFPSLGR